MPTIDSPVILIKFLFTGAEMIVTSKYSFPSLYSSTIIPIAFFFFQIFTYLSLSGCKFSTWDL